MEKLKKTCASWYDPCLSVDCPYCNNFICNLIKYVDDWESVFGKPLSSEKDIEFEYLCDKCGKTFIIDETCY